MAREYPRQIRSPLRRRLGAVAAVAGMFMAVLVACSPPEDAAEGDGGGGDVLTYGVVGSTKDQIDPYSPQSTVSGAAIWNQLYEGLTRLDNEGNVEMALAKSMTPNAANDVWTVKLRPGVKLHDGGTFGADDVIASVQRMLDPETAYAAAAMIDFVDPEGIEKVDDLTVKFHLTRPYGPFPEVWAYPRLIMTGADSTEEDPDGTGPFTLTSFAAGREAEFERFDDYWGEKPEFQTLRMVFFQDQPAITNALRGGQVDVAYSVPFTDAETLKSVPDIEFVESESATHLTVGMRLDVEPFDDPRVRLAMKLIWDREQIVANAFGGYAKVANDFNGDNTRCALPDVSQRTQDIGRAKELLAEAGVSNLELDLPTDGAFPGMLETAQLYAQQAAEAGVDVTVKKLDTASFLNKWRKWPFFVGFSGSQYLQLAAGHYLPDGEENATHMNDEEYNALAKRLYASSDEDEQCELIAAMQKIEYLRGGEMVPVYPLDLTPYRSNVHGLKPDPYGRTSYTFNGVSVD